MKKKKLQHDIRNTTHVDVFVSFEVTVGDDNTEW